MTVDQLLSFINEGTLVLIAVIALAEWIRYRDGPRLDVLLLFGALAAIVVISWLINLTERPVLLTLMSQLLLVAHPYLLLRLVLHFRRVDHRVEWAALFGMFLSSFLIVLVPAPLPMAVTLSIVGYFVCVEGYSALAFFRGALTTSGVTHWRLLLVAAGSALVAVAILIAGLRTVLPLATAVFSPLSQVSVTLAVLSFYLGFAPPQRLRQNWQFGELHRFLRQTAGHRTNEPIEDNLERLCVTAARSVGAVAAAALLRNEHNSQFVARGSTDHDWLRSAKIESPFLDRVWQEAQPQVVQIPSDSAPSISKFGERLGAGMCLAVPIASPERSWGVLVVFPQHKPLFVRDDLALLSLLSEQAAITIGYAHLLAELRGYAADLERRVAERTAELEESNKELDAFSYSVSHDLRAPLRAIDGFSRILGRDYADILPEGGQRYLHLVRENTQQMGHLVDDLLTFAHLGRQAVRKDHCHPTDLARQVLETLRAEQEGRSVEITLSELPSCLADPNLLRQVWMNLLSNALKFTRSRQIAQIQIGFEEKDGECIYFVKDNGVGFEMEYAEQLFKVFHRLHRAEEYEGTGVGLAIIHRIITRHGGRVWAEAQVDRGATFYFTLEPRPEALAAPGN